MSRWQRAALATGALVMLATLPAAPLAALESPAWSADGTTLSGVACVAGRPALVAIDGETGTRRWSTALTGIVRGCEELGKLEATIRPTSSGDAALLVLGQDLYWVRGDEPKPLALAPGRGEAVAPAPAPDGTAIAFLRAGELWTFSPGDRVPRRLAAGGADGAPAGRVDEFLWSPDSRSIAFRSGDRIGVVDLLSATPRQLDTPVGERLTLRGFVWRFDARAVVVSTTDSEKGSDTLSLCHPEKLYCRPLAARDSLGDSAPSGDVVFFEDGLVWADRAADGSIGLGWYDTLGRQRFEIGFGDVSVVDIASSIFDAHRVVVEIRAPGGAPAWRLVDLESHEGPQELKISAGVTPLFSPSTSLLAETTASGGRIAAHTLRGLDDRVRGELPPGQP